MQKIRLIYIGTSAISAPLLRALAKDDRFTVALAVTAPDLPAGRKLKLQPSPVKQAAQELILSIFQPTDINAEESLSKMRQLKPDFLVLMAYGKILSREVLEIPGRGCLNLHPSLLPCWRGATPVQSALLAGEPETGVSVMQMVERMDAGPVYAQLTIPIAPDDNGISLSEKLARLAAEKTPEVLIEIFEGKRKAEPQNEKQASYCSKITKSDGQIDWNEPAESIARKIRAYAGWPGTYTMWEGKMLKIIEGKVVADSYPAGHVLAAAEKMLVGTGKECLDLITVQLEGKKALLIREFIKGYPSFIGSTLDLMR